MRDESGSRYGSVARIALDPSETYSPLLDLVGPLLELGQQPIPARISIVPRVAELDCAVAPQLLARLVASAFLASE